jgi:hypothetical protein
MDDKFLRAISSRDVLIAVNVVAAYYFSSRKIDRTDQAAFVQVPETPRLPVWTIVLILRASIKDVSRSVNAAGASLFTDWRTSEHKLAIVNLETFFTEIRRSWLCSS